MITAYTTFPAIGLLAADSYTDSLGQRVLTGHELSWLLHVSEFELAPQLL